MFTQHSTNIIANSQKISWSSARADHDFAFILFYFEINLKPRLAQVWCGWMGEGEVGASTADLVKLGIM